jgi:hypothetical protein
MGGASEGLWEPLDPHYSIRLENLCIWGRFLALQLLRSAFPWKVQVPGDLTMQLVRCFLSLPFGSRVLGQEALA